LALIPLGFIPTHGAFPQEGGGRGEGGRWNFFYNQKVLNAGLKNIEKIVGIVKAKDVQIIRHETDNLFGFSEIYFTRRLAKSSVVEEYNLKF
jgi:hypothetical protein